MDSQTLCEIKKLDVLLKSLSDLLNESEMMLFCGNSEDETMPSEHYFEIIQQVFNLKTSVKVLCN